MRVLVIGGGVIGLSIAWELANRGAVVQVVERGLVGGGASNAAAGILPAARLDTASDPIDRLRGHSHQLYPQWTARIEQSSGIDVGLRRCGGIYLASSPGEAAALAGATDYWHQLGIESEEMTRSELKGRLPALATWLDSPQFRKAIWVPDEWQVRPAELVAGLVAACRSAGVQIDQQVTGTLESQGTRATFQIHHIGCPDPTHSPTRPTTQEVDQIVLSGGAWTGQIARELGLELSVVPIRGQMLQFRFSAPPFPCIVNEGHRYLVPREDGSLLVGSCEEEVGFETGTTPEMLEMLTKWAAGLIPELAVIQPERSWAGLRPAPADGFPILGSLPDVENLFVAYGHFRSGVHLAPATAERIADLIEGREPALSLPEIDAGRAKTLLPCNWG